ncbi:sodium/calcium exchanger 3 isoform X1 [Hyla sarda]|uniref:sodium/calcium exchanger 3 isoform X1 n=2 Tax=Hyla sarda TaxID=327740 RepID=UPI0024C3AE91|nr:sodium/calcium exchanger 3 isoform X1 [Hyla sarda]XP_056403143.1 sodium/calcium exchanger 3 isoform X1 [Hyla sarda]XP_056403144.1 sodium/calcium exchanger 3 isoform X1 [Hyla sarda]XP_056403145.1 sodium/calcium exchanger 3 isoform X1 [Hyla sarda]XP_056403146.1 sodium/calcium exchanger 3 isoform X1 [Hyla sarda]XP_056403147.1 sodium/calcium exchanger 3 isoform X1 [Hyla sarda]
MAWLKLRPHASAFLHFGLVTFILLLQSLQVHAVSTGHPPSAAQKPNNCTGSFDCKAGVILPIWYPENPSLGDKIARVIVYFVAMIYMFLGVSIIADRFMASIEVITSQEREIIIKKPNGETSTTTIRVWNETVSNLTLMALGSSAPEILLSLIEVCGHNFVAGDLGPSTIVGSAAFNMFIIIAICVYVIPDGEVRKIKHLRVFFVTAAWSIFAYIWLYMILAVFSPGVVQVWEGLLTLFFFPVCVVLAWVADRRLLFYKYMHKKYRTDKHRGIMIETEAEHPKGIEMDGKVMNSHFLDGNLLNMDGKEVDESRRDMIRILKDLKQKHPEKDLDQLVEMANYYALSHQQKSRAFYRIQATRMMTGAGNILKKHAAEQSKRCTSLQDICLDESEEFVSKIYFDPCSYQCLENCGAVLLTVVRKGGDISKTLIVDYKTEDGSANAGADYEFTEGTVVFKSGETQKEFSVGIIDDDIFEEDEHFFVRLSNLRIADAPEPVEPNTFTYPKAVLVSPYVASVTILDDDHAGIFTFECDIIRVSESIGVMEVKVHRTSGARGTVIVPFRTIEGTAKGGGEDFEDAYGELEFKNDETVKAIQIKIIDDEEYEKNKTFHIELRAPHVVDMSVQKALLLNQAIELAERKPSVEEEEAKRIAEMGKPILGEHPKLEVVIEESYEFKSTVDKLIKKTNLALVVGTHSWRDQFMEAITVSAAGDEEEDESGEERLPSCFDYVMHFLTVFWKVLFACVPPTEYLNGWACFVVSIIIIGILTAIIGDLASHFGCTIGLKDSVTAVVFVAFGTSVPDTFASKVAATQDVYADASIGNVTGSNAVNVFLGIGIAWSVAAIYWASKGQEFHVQAGTLAFSVTLFTIFAFVCISVLLYRRRPSIGGELGGPRGCRLATTLLFVTLWLLYILFATLEAYCYIKGF